jgi:hypothetical protein
MQDVEAALLGHLANPKVRMPWMYEMLAVALEHNLAPEEAVKQTLGYAVVLARKPDGEAESLITIVDMMGMRKWYTLPIPDPKGGTAEIEIGELLDEAHRRLPHRPEPFLRSVDLAALRKDPERMAWAVEGLMALGWPNVDASWRAEARKYAEKLADQLREEGRTSEAETMIGRVEAAEPRDLLARLSWEGGDEIDLDLEVDEPLGATCAAATPRTVFGGALIQNGRGKEREEIYSCPRGFDGTYTFRVRAVIDDPMAPASSVRLEVFTHEGSAEEKAETFEIDLKDPKPITVTLEGGRRTEVLPYVVPKTLGIKIPLPTASPKAPAGAPAKP